MELYEYIRLIRKKWYIILVMAILSVGIGSVYSFYFLEPVYESSIPVIIGSERERNESSAENGTQSYNDIMMYQKLVKTYCEFVKTKVVVEDAIENSGIKTTYEDAIKMISVDSQSDTEFLRISVKSANKLEAMMFANALAKSLKEITAEIKNIDNVMLVDEATLPTLPANKSPIVYIILSLFIGVCIAVALIILLDLLDNTVKDNEEVEKILDVSVIGSIPFDKQKNKDITNDNCSLSNELTTYYKPLSLVSEHYKSLRTNIQFSMIDKKSCIISVTSCAPSEGKSTVISNTAVTVAQSGKKVLLIDCDLRKPVIHKKFGLPNKRGLTNYLLGEFSIDEVIQTTDVEKLSIITCGEIPPNPSEILTSQKYYDLIDSLKAKYDYIFIDAPPILVVTDAQIIASKVDGMLLVAEYGSTEKKVLEKAKECLDRVEGKCIGVIINQIPLKEMGYYGYGRYGKYGKYGRYGTYSNGYYVSESE